MSVGVMEFSPVILNEGTNAGDMVAETSPVADGNNTTSAMAEAAPSSANVDNDGPLLYPAIEVDLKNDMSGTARLLADTALAGVKFRSWPDPAGDGTLRVHPTNEEGVVAFKEFRAKQDSLREEKPILKQQRARELDPEAAEWQIRPLTEEQAEKWERREQKINRHLFRLVDSGE